jgi:hypothetical protein
MSTIATPSLGDALRLLGLPLDVPIDEQMLVGAYREAARAHHPDAAPDDLRDAQTERMREINVARDLVRAHLSRLGSEAFATFAPDDGGRGSDLWWDVSADDLAELGIRWNPNTVRVPWAKRVQAARLSLGVVVGDEVTVEESGTLRVGRVTEFDESTRVGLRTSLNGIPIEVRRVGLEVEVEGETRTVDAGDVQACGWHCPVCLRTSPHGTPRLRPCPRCLRRFRGGYPRWREAALARGRLKRRIARLGSDGGTPFTPRRYPAYRETEAALAAARQRLASIEATHAALSAALAAAEGAEAEATARIARARSESGVERRSRERSRWAAEARRVRTAIAQLESQAEETRESVVGLARELEQLERSLRIRHESAERARVEGAERRRRDLAKAEADLREVELELAALNPDAPALLEGFDAWGQSAERWLH